MQLSHAPSVLLPGWSEEVLGKLIKKQEGRQIESPGMVVAGGLPQAVNGLKSSEQPVFVYLSKESQSNSSIYLLLIKYLHTPTE